MPPSVPYAHHSRDAENAGSIDAHKHPEAQQNRRKKVERKTKRVFNTILQQEELLSSDEDDRVEDD